MTELDGLRAALATTFAALCVGGCSPKSEEPPTDYGHASETLASTYCNELRACCEAAAYLYDRGSCMEQMMKFYQSSLEDYKRTIQIAYDPDALLRCVDAIRTHGSHCGGDPVVTSVDRDPVAIACRGILTGTLQPGETCRFDAECLSPDPSTLSACKRNGIDGGVCTQRRLRAGVGEVCTTATSDGTDTSPDCDPDRGWCDPSDAGVGACRSWLSAGEPCGPDRTGCKPGETYCNRTTSICVPSHGAGEACLYGQCATGLACNPDPTTDGGGICLARPNQGADPITPQRCGFGPLSNGDPDASILPRSRSLVPTASEGF